MNSNETRKAKQSNKTSILEKLMESIMNEEVDSEGIEDLSRNVDKATINFKIGIIKFIDDYPKMRKSLVSLHFLKNNFIIIKEVGREHHQNFNNILRF